ncbi:MAG: hypothetical protein COA42_15250 [Alteromonadaceae bacterium]|nr:MAG: hypothetical protein COA42_15250 [Alteromonadaceae bacterium]
MLKQALVNSEIADDPYMVADIAKAYIVSRDVFKLSEFQDYIASLDNRVPAEIQMRLMSNMMRRVRRGTRWFLRNRRAGLEPAKDVAVFREGLTVVQQSIADGFHGLVHEEWLSQRQELEKYGVPEEWILPLCMPANLFSGLSIVEATVLTEVPIARAAKMFFLLMESVKLDWFASELSNVTVESYWQAQARESYIDDLEAQLRRLTVSLLALQGERTFEEVIDLWQQKNHHMLQRWNTMVHEVQGAQVTDYAMFSVALRELIDLAQATIHCQSLD